jgi:uncharacterized oxidoreductase
MGLAVERARRHGVAVVTVRRSNHVGRLADFAEQAAEAGLVGLVFANDSGALQRVAPYGAIDGRLSTNPLAFGIPRRSPPHLVVDISTSVVAAGKLRAALAAGEAVPEGWVQDETGQGTTDPAVAFGAREGTILPMGGHKGYALGLVVEVLAGVLSGAGASRPEPGPDLQGVCMLAVDVARFLPLDQFVREVEAVVGWVKTARPREGVTEVLVPGENGWRTMARRRAEGIPIAGSTWARIVAIAREVGAEVPEPLAP